MAHVKENDVMIDFYLCPSFLQREILHQYQSLSTDGNKRETLVDFLKETSFFEKISEKEHEHPTA
jgi:hypothetical protein